MAWHGLAQQGWQARPGMTRTGAARLGKAGKAGHDKARLG
jgi:hypothetical protein